MKALQPRLCDLSTSTLLLMMQVHDEYYSLMTGSILGRGWAVQLLETTQQVVTYFRSSNNKHTGLLAAADHFHISTP